MSEAKQDDEAEAQQQMYMLPPLSLRQWYAGLAMQAMVTAITELHQCGIIVNRPNDVAELSHLYADAMIERGQK